MICDGVSFPTDQLFVTNSIKQVGCTQGCYDIKQYWIDFEHEFPMYMLPFIQVTNSLSPNISMEIKGKINKNTNKCFFFTSQSLCEMFSLFVLAALQIRGHRRIEAVDG